MDASAADADLAHQTVGGNVGAVSRSFEGVRSAHKRKPRRCKFVQGATATPRNLARLRWRPFGEVTLPRRPGENKVYCARMGMPCRLLAQVFTQVYVQHTQTSRVKVLDLQLYCHIVFASRKPVAGQSQANRRPIAGQTQANQWPIAPKNGQSR